MPSQALHWQFLMQSVVLLQVPTPVPTPTKTKGKGKGAVFTAIVQAIEGKGKGK